jgi:hypothetical protein
MQDRFYVPNSKNQKGKTKKFKQKNKNKKETK